MTTDQAPITPDQIRQDLETIADEIGRMGEGNFVHTQEFAGWAFSRWPLYVERLPDLLKAVEDRDKRIADATKWLLCAIEKWTDFSDDGKKFAMMAMVILRGQEKTQHGTALAAAIGESEAT
jgi:hypothetical protein